MPGRWTQYDEDEYRLPEGTTRVGYDADTGRYTFSSTDGRMYEGEPGESYGVMRPVGSSVPTRKTTQIDAREGDGELSPVAVASMNAFLGGGGPDARAATPPPPPASTETSPDANALRKWRIAKLQNAVRTIFRRASKKVAAAALEISTEPHPETVDDSSSIHKSPAEDCREPSDADAAAAAAAIMAATAHEGDVTASPVDQQGSGMTECKDEGS